MEEYGLSSAELISRDSRRLHSSRRDNHSYSKRDWIAAIKKVYKPDEQVFAGYLQKIRVVDGNEAKMTCLEILRGIDRNCQAKNNSCPSDRNGNDLLPFKPLKQVLLGVGEILLDMAHKIKEHSQRTVE
jgi:hypothetical protein